LFAPGTSSLIAEKRIRSHLRFEASRRYANGNAQAYLATLKVR